MTLAAFLRLRLPGVPWRRAQAWVESGKVRVDGRVEPAPATRLAGGARVALDMAAPRPGPTGPQPRLVYTDQELVVIDKPAGVTSVPFEEGERGTALELARGALRRQGAPGTAAGLHVVHRLDRDTSGLMLFARTKRAERALQLALRAHVVERVYLCVAHGRGAGGRIASELAPDRGDGLRGTPRRPTRGGKPAITHVRAVAPLAGATLCAVRLETGRTHQIRIHLAERGHPLVGERVYIRDFLRAGQTPIPSPRLLLHAAALAFAHPTRGDRLRFTSPLPPAFVDALVGLGGRPEDAAGAVAEP